MQTLIFLEIRELEEIIGHMTSSLQAIAPDP